MTTAIALVDKKKLRHDIKSAVFVLKTAYRVSLRDSSLKDECEEQINESLAKLEAIIETLKDEIK